MNIIRFKINSKRNGKYFIKTMMLPEKNVKIVSERLDENISEANKNFNSQSMNKIPIRKK